MTSHTVADTARLERRPLPLWSALSLLLPLIAVLAVAAANGGYFATAFGWTALAFAWVTLIAVVLVAPRWGRLDATWVVGAALLCVFTFSSAVWAGSAGTAIDQGQRAVVYATAAAGALLLLRRRDLERWLAGLVFGATAICFYSLGTRLFADHFGGPKPDYRLFVPVGYWNALGIFAGAAALLAFGAASWDGSRCCGSSPASRSSCCCRRSTTPTAAEHGPRSSPASSSRCSTAAGASGSSWRSSSSCRCPRSRSGSRRDRRRSPTARRRSRPRRMPGTGLPSSSLWWRFCRRGSQAPTRCSPDGSGSRRACGSAWLRWSRSRCSRGSRASSPITAHRRRSLTAPITRSPARRPVGRT